MTNTKSYLILQPKTVARLPMVGVASALLMFAAGLTVEPAARLILSASLSFLIVVAVPVLYVRFFISSMRYLKRYSNTNLPGALCMALVLYASIPSMVFVVVALPGLVWFAFHFGPI